MSSLSATTFQLKAFRFQLRVQPAQVRLLARWSGQLRWIWNQALAKQRARHAQGEKYASYVDMAKWLTAWRNDPVTAWLAEGPAQPQQHVLRRLDEAYKRFFKKAGGFPSFKKHGFDPGLRFPDAKQFELDQINGRLKLPKFDWIRLRLSRPVQGEIRNLSISREGCRWYVSIQTRSAACQPAAGLLPTLGIDLGVTAFAATSQGTLIAPLSALHRHIACQRNDWLHKLTTGLASEHAVIAIEDLKVGNMSASAAGTAAAPGKNVKQKAGLNRAILDQGWSEFRCQLGYKLAANGGVLIAVNPAYTSQTCSACGHCSKDNRKTQGSFECVACCHQANADLNAATNILAAGISAAGHAASACGEVVRPGAAAKQHRAASVKQEPTEVVKLVQETEHA